MSPRRAPAVLAVIGLLVGGGVLDRRHRASPAPRAAPSPAMPEAAPAGALSSTWFCAGGTSAPDGAADGTIVVANPRPRAVRGTITFFASQGAPPRALPLELGPGEVRAIRDQDAVTAPFASALVDVEGGEVVAEHTVSGPLGADVAPCASSASTRWYFADGGTTRDATEVLCLFNPFPEDAIVDLSFTTEGGRVVPQALQALVVPRRSVVPVDVGQHVLRRKAVSVAIVARRGRLIADRIQRYDGTGGRKGLALLLGTPSPATRWYFPDGYVSEKGRINRFQLYNPTRREAKVELDLALERGSAEPFELTVPAHGRYTMLVNVEGRIPKDVGFATTIRSLNGVGVVAERSIDAAKPTPIAGLASTLGARAPARRWAFAAGLVTDTVEEWLVVQNPAGRAVEVSVQTFADGRRVTVPGLSRVRLGPGRRVAIRLRDHVMAPRLPLQVEASGPVVAERGIYRLNSLGISSVVGIALR